MAYLDPTEAFDRLKATTIKAVKGHFPVEGKKHTLIASDVFIDDNKDVADIHSQREAKEKGRSWVVPIRAKLQLKDNETGKILDTQEVTVGQLPKITSRHSHIVDGNEWQVNNQFRLKSGVYTLIKDSGVLEAQWNLEQGLGFNMNFDPKSRRMSVRLKDTNVPLYPLMKAMGVDDDAMQKTWGKEILGANRIGRGAEKDPQKYFDNSMYKAFKSLFGRKAETPKEALKGVIEAFGKTKLRPDSTEVTLGKPFSTVDGAALLAGSDVVLKVSRREKEPDNRDSLVFKDFLATEDLIAERISKRARRDIARKLSNKLDKTTKIREMVSPDTFGRPIKQFFTNSALSERPTQMNPVQFLVGARRTTLGGEGGIQDVHRIPDSARSIDPSAAGFLDPIHTPENPRIGTVLQMGTATRKIGKDIKTRVYNMKTGRKEYITPSQALASNLAFGDQYIWKEGKPTPKGRDIKIVDKAGDFSIAKPSEVDYAIMSPKGMFDVSTNLIPFLQNDQGNRTSVASRQLEQAVALVSREAPLVQVKGEGAMTWERGIGESYNSHKASVAGKVTKITADDIYIRKGVRTHKVPLYNDFPLNDNKSVLTSYPLVKVGDRVDAGQIVADTNFTREGTLALGTNLRTAYMPWRGYNFEDGVVISETAAEKLKSEHMLREGITADKNTILDKEKFFAEAAGQYSKEQSDKLDDAGIILPGMRVAKGDILIAALKKEQWRPEHDELAKFSKSLIRAVKPRAQIWDKDYPGTVTKVIKHGKETTVYIKAQTLAIVGDKLAGRHGNKGIITKIVPDHEMPMTQDGSPMEILLNPTGIPTRINLGQVLETVAGKIAMKTGKPYVVNNFDSTVPDYTRKMMADLKKHNISDTEILFDPKTNKPMFAKPVLWGHQYMLKLYHMAETGIRARSRGAYDINNQPKKGPKGKAQSMDAAGLYSLLAHGARENIREMQTIKSDRNDDFWSALQNGDELPTPKVPFAYKKFHSYLAGMGINTTKEGNNIQLSPLTDRQTVAMSNGELKRPDLALMGKTVKPEKGSIFDEEITGTKVKDGILYPGDKWSHFTLSTAMPNPVFETPIRTVLDLKGKEFKGIIEGTEELNGKTGPEAIAIALRALDVNKELIAVNKALPGARKSHLSKLRKKAKYLSALQQMKLTASEAYTMRKVPVLPPSMRPVSVLPNGDFSTDDLNDLYRGLAQTNDQLLKPEVDEIPPDMEGGKYHLQRELYDGLKALTLTGMTQYQNRHKKGIAEMIGGSGSPKYGFFQNKMIGKRQDLSMRGVIVPEPTLSVDEVGIPESAAKELYKPFVQRRMVRSGYTPREAEDSILAGDLASIDALKAEMDDRPLMLKRDPVLHKYGIQAYRPRLVKGSAVKIHPLATAGYNADFDGDKMSAFLPVSSAAVKEAFNMLPSRTLFTPSTGRLMLKPSQESMLGLYDLSKFGKNTTKRFRNVDELAREVGKGNVHYTDVVTLDDPTIQGSETEPTVPFSKLAAPKKSQPAVKPIRTTIGRLLLNSALPERLRHAGLLTDPNFELTKAKLEEVLTHVAKNSAPSEFTDSVDKLKNMGYEHATGFSFGLKDLLADTKIRDQEFAKARVKEKAIRAKYKGKSRAERDQQLVDLYAKAGKVILTAGKKKADASENRMYDWVRSGARGNWGQYHQMTISPIQVVDSSGKALPVPIDKSYSEGLDSGSYYAAMFGARMGVIGRQMSTADPGALTKQMMQASMSTMITSEDCGTNKSIQVGVDDPTAIDRYLAKDVSLGVRGGSSKGKIAQGTLVTPAVVSRLKSNKIKDVPVRSPLKCAEEQGLCAVCFGLNESGFNHQKGVNIGVIATQALGEPMTQMAMNAFHTGGVAGARGSSAKTEFARVSELMKFPRRLPGSAVLATTSGKVDRITQDKATGGFRVYVGGEEHFVPALKGKPLIKAGQMIKRGDGLSAGPKNPHELLPLTNMATVQRYITDELGVIYGGQSTLHRRNTEVMVRNLTNLSQVDDPGDFKGLFVNDKMTTSQIDGYNRGLKPGQKPIKHTQILKSVEILPNEMQTDWMARLQSRDLKRTILDAAAEGWSSDIHGVHPIPGMAYGREFGKGTPQSPFKY